MCHIWLYGQALTPISRIHHKHPGVVQRCEFEGTSAPQQRPGRAISLSGAGTRSHSIGSSRLELRLCPKACNTTNRASEERRWIGIVWKEIGNKPGERSRKSGVSSPTTI